MNTNKYFIMGLFLLLFPALFFSGSNDTRATIGSSPDPWIGEWLLTDDQPHSAGRIAVSSQATVEIRPTINGNGIEITRKAPQQPDVKETLILDGTTQSLNEKDCSGWQISKWIPEARVIIGSSEINCKDSGSFRISSLKMILPYDQMVDILGIITGDQTRVAMRRLMFNRELPAAAEVRSQSAGTAARKAASAPWDLASILQLAGTVDEKVLQAALIEKNVRLDLDVNSLKQMKASKLSTKSIDLLLALAYPQSFHVKTNGEVTLQPISESTLFPSITAGGSSLSSSRDYMFALLSDRLLYYGSPFWWDRYIVFNPAPNLKVTSSTWLSSRPRPVAVPSPYYNAGNPGFVQIMPANAGHGVFPLPGIRPQSGNHSGSSSGASTSSGGASNPASTGSGGASSSGYSQGGSSSTGKASPR
jgi:hypothetical protein